MPLSSQMVDELHSQNSDDGILQLVEIDHPDLTEPLRIANELGAGTVTALGEEWAKFSVDLELPSEQEDGAQEVRITFGNISGVIGQTLNALTTAPSLKLYAVKFSNLNLVEFSLSAFVLEKISTDLTSVSATLGREAFAREPIPAQRFLPQWFPLLARSRSE